MEPTDEELARWAREVLLFDSPEPESIASGVPVPATPVGTSSARRKRSSRRRIVYGVAAVVAVGVGGGVAAVALWPSGPAGQPQVVTCWSDAQASVRWGTQRTDADEDPVGLCAVPWTNGDFGTSGPPEQTACVSGEGTIAVIPGDSGVCEAVGLVLLDDTGSGPLLDVFAALDDRLVQPLGAGCFTEQETTELVDQVVADLDLGDWEVTLLHPFDQNRPCGAVHIDVETNTIQISPRPTGPG